MEKALNVTNGEGGANIVEVDQETTSSENPAEIIEDSPLAKGLPEWNIEPPVIAVRRKTKVS